MNPYLPTGADDDPTAPWWDREETITAILCACECYPPCENEVNEEGEVCAECLKYQAEHQ